MSLKARSGRLSFLGSKRKDSDPPGRDASLINGESTDAKPTSSHSGGAAKDNPRRGSFFRVQSADAANDRKDSTDVSSGRRSSEREEGSGPDNGLGKKGSVRKRLSLLKLGKKGGKGTNGTMGSLDEE